VVELGERQGFRIPANGAIFVYVALEGQVRIAGIGADVLALEPGEVLLVLSGEAHALRTSPEAVPEVLEFLHAGSYADSPISLRLGEGAVQARLLAGRLKVSWPGGQYPRGLPAVLRLAPGEALVDPARLLATARGAGGAALLSYLARLLFIQAFREHPGCQQAFGESGLHDPVSRARQFIERHPHQHWTVARLARKVGMGRSTFAARFAAEIGQTPMELLAEVRLRAAAELLQTTGLKVVEIAEQVGYRSEAAFSHRFRRFFGRTPGSLRRGG
jgi:AraC-like DNA-binding protein